MKTWVHGKSNVSKTVGQTGRSYALQPVFFLAWMTEMLPFIRAKHAVVCMQWPRHAGDCSNRVKKCPDKCMHAACGKVWMDLADLTKVIDVMQGACLTEENKNHRYIPRHKLKLNLGIRFSYLSSSLTLFELETKAIIGFFPQNIIIFRLNII